MAILDWRVNYRAIAAKAAGWDASAETWNTPVAMPNLGAISLTPIMENDERNVYGARERFLSVLVGVEVSLEFTGKDEPSAAEMTGFTSTTTGSGASEVRKTRFTGGTNLPYFGLAVQIEADDGGDVHLYIPYLKLDSLLAMEMQSENKFVIPTVTAKAGRLRLANGNLYPVYDEIEHPSLTTLTSDFNTDFLVLS